LDLFPGMSGRVRQRKWRDNIEYILWCLLHVYTFSSSPFGQSLWPLHINLCGTQTVEFPQGNVPSVQGPGKVK
jgi:hypothetical protein